jgi:DUF4097 and DUF4098 domain-containing protein YvlB
MSSVPPNVPPGVPPGSGAPFPPSDPKTQWRIHREQQRAAWRTYREAWKANRHAWKASYAGAYGPRVPSIVGPVILIAIGVVGLLVVSGRITAGQFWAWYGHWWPLLLIAAGLAMLGEWALDLRRGTAVRRGGVVGILILVAILGAGAAGWNNFLGPLRAQFGDQGEELFNAFGLPEHDFDRPALSAQIPTNAGLEIQNPRGDVSVIVGGVSSIEVQAHEVAFAKSDADASKIFDAEAPRLTVNGNAVLVKSESNASGRVNLTVTVPKTTRVTINSSKGDVTAAGLGAGLFLYAHGDVQLNDLAGPVEVRFSGGRNDFSVHQLQGDLTASGNSGDFTLSGIKGKVTQNGEILGTVHMENISGAIHLHTSVTELELAELPGDLTLDSDDLRVNEAKGQVRVITHSKDIDLSQIYGDSYVENRNGSISVEPAGAYSVEAKNRKGNVEVTLPPNTSATVDGRTHNGDIVTEYGLAVNGEENKTVSGKIGSGASRIVLSADNGDVRIKKGSGFPPLASLPAVPLHPKVPDLSGVPHMKTQKAIPSQPVTQ